MFKQRIAPLVFGTADRSFEGGIHDFPSVPFFVPYVIHFSSLGNTVERGGSIPVRYGGIVGSWRTGSEVAAVEEH